MNKRKRTAALTGIVLFVSLITASLTALLLSEYYNRMHVRALGEICEGILEKQPEAKEAVLTVLKEYEFEPEKEETENIILAYGYGQSGFLQSVKKYGRWPAALGFVTGGLLFLILVLFFRKREAARIRGLTDYLEKVNVGETGVLFPAGEDEISKLQDEIYKTVTQLHQMKDEAVKARQNFAENLYNIAHQIKTPITSISLSVQMWRQNASPAYQEQIRRQLSRLIHLEESLLLLSRIDAGTLPLNRKEEDVFTILTLAADNLQELFLKAGVSVDVEESGEAAVFVDLDWTMEAIMNLLKNCMEHTPPQGKICCSYEKNPIYTKICIWDTGTGFAPEDIPHLFERFYRGKNAGSGGIGIGLALSKAIIESQNGTISAGNLPEGGACFEIRFYCH